MSERYKEGYFASDNDYMRLFYHYYGDIVERLIILNTINGDVVRLTRQNPVSGCYDMCDPKFAEFKWTCFPISKNKFDQIWEIAPGLDLLRDRYVMEHSLIYGSELKNYIHYHGEWAERQITIYKGQVQKYSKEKPTSATSHMCDQPFSILDFEYDDIVAKDVIGLLSDEFISKEEFEEVWQNYEATDE